MFCQCHKHSTAHLCSLTFAFISLMVEQFISLVVKRFISLAISGVHKLMDQAAHKLTSQAVHKLSGQAVYKLSGQATIGEFFVEDALVCGEVHLASSRKACVSSRSFRKRTTNNSLSTVSSPVTVSASYGSGSSPAPPASPPSQPVSLPDNNC